MKFANRLILGTLAVVGTLVVMLVVIVDRRLDERVRATTLEAMAREARFIGFRWTADTDPHRLDDDRLVPARTRGRRRVDDDG